MRKIISEFKSEFQESEPLPVLIALFDQSGSMGTYELEIATRIMNKIQELTKKKYGAYEEVLITHDTEAHEVHEISCSPSRQTGGTICSSALKMVNRRLDEIHVDSPKPSPIHIVQFSDGDNHFSDNQQCLTELQKSLSRCTGFHYFEINTYKRTSTLMQTYRELNHHMNFQTTVINHSSDITKLCEKLSF
jgi:hypothetical protein